MSAALVAVGVLFADEALFDSDVAEEGGEELDIIGEEAEEGLDEVADPLSEVLVERVALLDAEESGLVVT